MTVSPVTKLLAEHRSSAVEPRVVRGPKRRITALCQVDGQTQRMAFYVKAEDHARLCVLQQRDPTQVAAFLQRLIDAAE
jgi:hypothetical protein